jgi:hypothetical protein
MKKPNVEQALQALDMIHSQLYVEKSKNPTLQNKVMLLQIENVMNTLGYNLETKFKLQQGMELK